MRRAKSTTAGTYTVMGNVEGQPTDLCSVRANSVPQAISRARSALRERHALMTADPRRGRRVHIDACILTAAAARAA